MPTPKNGVLFHALGLSLLGLFSVSQLSGQPSSIETIMLRSDISSVKRTVSDLESKARSLESDVSSLKSTVSGLESKVRSLESDVRSVDSDTKRPSFSEFLQWALILAIAAGTIKTLNDAK